MGTRVAILVRAARRGSVAEIAVEDDDRGVVTMDKLHFTVWVRLKHPLMLAAKITEAMKREPEHMWDVGDPRELPDGTILPGVRSEIYWAFTREVYGRRRFFDEVDSILEEFMDRTDFINCFVESGGAARIDLGLSGGENIGDILTRDRVLKLYNSGFDLGIEISWENKQIIDED